MIVVLLWLIALIAAHELSKARATAATAIVAVEPAGVRSGPRLDIYGNQVFEAVGDYRVDPRGEIYERHAPDTAVLRLGPAGT